MNDPRYILADGGSGYRFYLDPKRPRADLLEQLESKHAEKLYVDTRDGETKHVGYIVRGVWYRLYNVSEWEGSRHA